MSAPTPTHDQGSIDLAQILIQVMASVTEFLEVERSTLFLYDEEKRELWTPVAQGVGEIRTPLGTGLAAHSFETGDTIRLADAYTDPRFNATVDKRTGFRTRDIFCRPITDSSGKRIGVIQLLNRRVGPMDAKDEGLLDAICGQAGIAIENAQLFLKLKKVHDSEKSLHTELASKHGELQKAFLKIEESSTAQELLGRRVQKVRLISMLTVVGLFVVVGLFAWLRGSNSNQMTRHASERGEISWHTVTTAPFRTEVAFLGNIEPLEVQNLTAPLRGRLAEKNFQYGELVTKDQILARIDTKDVEVELRNAEAALFKAIAELKRLEGWKTGPEVARAQRNLLKARLNFDANQRNLTEMKQLSELGIIAQSSLESAKQQFVSQEADFRSAQEDLENTLATATEDRVTIARYDVENTRLTVAELKEKISRAVIRAPFSGIVILPGGRPTAGRASGNDGYYEQGSTINQGDILLAVGNLEGVAVKTKADEVDIVRIRHGQPVQITGDAFSGITLAGEVAYVSSQAVVGGSRPYFEIIVKTRTLRPEELKTVRLGMTARLSITVYDTPSAVVVPVASVRRTDEGASVFKRGAGGKAESAKVSIGAAGAQVVEIVAGLSPGEVIVSNVRTVEP